MDSSRPAVQPKSFVEIPRIPEPASLDPAHEAALYAEMDFSEVNQRFVEDLISGGSVGPRIMDFGCGPGDISIRLVAKLEDHPGWVQENPESEELETPAELQIMAMDHEVEMLEIAKREIDIAGFLGKIFLEHADIEQLDDFDSEMADTVLSNTVLHHLDDPAVGIVAAHRLVRRGGRVFFRDLARPDSLQDVEKIVAQHGDPENEAASQRLRQSLHAALRVEEVREVLRGLGVDESSVQMTSDRHWTLDFMKT